MLMLRRTGSNQIKNIKFNVPEKGRKGEKKLKTTVGVAMTFFVFLFLLFF